MSKLGECAPLRLHPDEYAHAFAEAQRMAGYIKAQVSSQRTNLSSLPEPAPKAIQTHIERQYEYAAHLQTLKFGIELCPPVLRRLLALEVRDQSPL